MNSIPSTMATATINTTATTALLKDKKEEDPDNVSSTVAAVDKGEPSVVASATATELGVIEEEMDKKRESSASASIEDDPSSPATVFRIQLKQPDENLRHKMSVPELCRNFSAVAWCGRLNVIACAAETCARLPSSHVKPPFWIPIHIVNPERPTESAIFNVAADSPRDSVQFMEWSPISCPRALLIANFHGRISIWTQPSRGPVNLVQDATCWQCEHEWRQDLAVVTKWLSGMSQYRWLPSNCSGSSNSKPMFEEKYLSFGPQTSARWPNFLCICSVFSSGSVQLHWSQWPPSQNAALPKWFSTSKGLLGAGPSGIMAADAVITEAGTLHVAGVPIVNPSTVVVWEVIPGPGSNFQTTIKTNASNGVPPSLNPPCWIGFAPLAAYLFSWQEYLGAEHKQLPRQDMEPDYSVSLHCLPVSNFSAYVSPEAAAQSTATTTWGSSVTSVAFDPTQGGSVIAVVIVEGQYMSPYDPDEGPSITGWRIQRWESSCQPVVLHPIFGNPSSSLSGQSPMQPVWLTKVNKSIKSLTDFKALQTSVAAEMVSDDCNFIDSTLVKVKKHGLDCYDVPSDIRMLAHIVFSSHGGEVAVAFLHGEVHLFSGTNFLPVDSFVVNIGFSVAAPAFSSSSCCLASVWHDMDTEHTVLKIMRVIPPCAHSCQGKVGSTIWERAIADRFWWSLLVGVDWWDAVGCTQSAAEDCIVSLNSVIAMLDADFHALPSVLHRQQHGPSLDRIKCRLLEGTSGQEVRALVLDMQARLLLDMLGKGIESALVHPESLITEPWHASSETLSSLDSEAMTVEPALIASIQAYVDAVLDLASHFITRLRRYASFCRTLGHAVGASAGSSGTRMVMANPNHGSTSSSTSQGGQNGTASSIGNAHMQTWVQGAIAKINSTADGAASSMPNPINGPSPFMPISINTGTFPGTPAVRLIGDCHFLHRLCQLLLFCLFFRRKQLPQLIGAVQRCTDANPVKSISTSGKGLEEMNISSKPASGAVKLEDNQSSRVAQSIPSTKGLDEAPVRPPRFGFGNAGQGYTSEEVKVLFLILVDLCKRTAGLQHPLPASQVGTSNIQVSLHYIDGNCTVLPEVVEVSLGPHMQNMPRPRGADAAGLLLRELELHPPAEEWHKRNMFGGPWSDLDDAGWLNQASDKPNALFDPFDISVSYDHHSSSGSQGLWPRKRRLSERDAAFGLRTSVGLGAYLGVIGSRRDVVTAVWKTGLEGVWYKCVRCLRQTCAFASPNSANPSTVNEREAWWISRWAYCCPMCGGAWVRVV